MIYDIKIENDIKGYADIDTIHFDDVKKSIFIEFEPSPPLPYEDDTYQLGLTKRGLVLKENDYGYNEVYDHIKEYIREKKLNNLGI